MSRKMVEPSVKHMRAMSELGDALDQFKRNGFWGTCGGYPRDSSG